MLLELMNARLWYRYNNEELFAEAQKMAQLRYQSYVRKTQENWE